ncbi:hypothetical protein QQP08_019240 [Theobroma cacao]|nr:hypothetical protein QQP08_019240 [Theobroma cacao]
MVSTQQLISTADLFKIYSKLEINSLNRCRIFNANVYYLFNSLPVSPAVVLRCHSRNGSYSRVDHPPVSYSS